MTTTGTVSVLLHLEQGTLHTLEQEKPAYGLKAGGVPTRADRCCYVVHSDYSPKRAARAGGRTGGTNSSSGTLENIDSAMEYVVDPVHGRVSTGKAVCGVTC